MIYVYFDEEKMQASFLPEEHANAGVLIGTINKMPQSSLAFVAHAMLINKGIKIDRGISVVAAATAV